MWQMAWDRTFRQAREHSEQMHAELLVKFMQEAC
jgi:hypothetical protein